MSKAVEDVVRLEEKIARLAKPLNLAESAARQYEMIAGSAKPLGLGMFGGLQRKIKTSPPHQDTGGHSAVRSHLIAPKQSESIYTKSSEFETPCPRDEHGEEDTGTDIKFVSEAKLETSDCAIQYRDAVDHSAVQPHLRVSKEPIYTKSSELEASGDISNRLEQVDPQLVVPYAGAQGAFIGKNADYVRHILTSLGELWNHLLRQLAPNDLVVPWIGTIDKKGLLDDEGNPTRSSACTCPRRGPTMDLLDEKGNPTRRGRMRYLYRELNDYQLNQFLKKVLKYISSLNRLHELKIGLTHDHLRTTLVETDQFLRRILWTVPLQPLR